ncbi:class I adenylate-forming enzyme family protein [Bacillus sp. JJ1533]|uniref:class I adenylate-forming enzyme family protein n=1 Tax=Bacillus sp. JJ1533 TaxID=3122959 RepID=UPI002FFE5E2D
MNNQVLTVGKIPEYFGSKADTKSQIAVVSDNGFRKTWKQINERSNQVARLVKEEWGLKRGDKVVTYLLNCGEYIEIIYGLAKLGIGIVPLNFRFVSREVEYAISHSDAKGIFVSKELLPTLNASLSKIKSFPSTNISVIGEKGDYEKSIERFLNGNVPIEANEDDLFWLAFTGGTTGYPKACIVTQRTVLTYWTLMTLEFEVLKRDYMLIAGAFYHGLGFLNALQQLFVGGKTFILGKFDPAQVLKIIEQEKITATAMVPTMYSSLIHYPLKEQYNVNSIQVLICTGAPLEKQRKRDIVQYFDNAVLNEFYGATESGLFTVLKIKENFSKADSIGLPAFGMEVKLLDEDGNEVPVGEVGQFYKRGPILGGEYYKNPKATDELYKGEWCSVGDLGYQDEDGYYYMVGRKKDMVISGGVNIYPDEIEKTILLHPGIQEVAVIGVPDEKWGEKLKAFIVTKEGARVTEEEISDICTQNLASYKNPRIITFLDELPKNAAGKILKRELKNLNVGVQN